MKNELKVFEKEEFGQVRTVELDNSVWFVASDVAKILEYQDTEHMTRRLDVDEKQLLCMTGILGYAPVSGGNPNFTIINESGLYNAILGSKKPEAKAFKKWVTSEVLPSIRKTGGYAINTPKTFAEALQLAADQARQIEMDQKKIAEDAPKVEFFDTVARVDETFPLGVFVKMLSLEPRLGRNKLMALLRDEKILMSDNLPYQTYLDQGMFKVVEVSKIDNYGHVRVYPTTMIYVKGQNFIVRFLIAQGYVVHIDNNFDMFLEEEDQ